MTEPYKRPASQGPQKSETPAINTGTNNTGKAAPPPYREDRSEYDKLWDSPPKHIDKSWKSPRYR